MQVLERFYRSILDTIPLPAFLVDERLQVYELNQAAVDSFGANSNTKFVRRPGDVFHCLYSQDAPNVCGRGEQCGDCGIRNSVLGCLAGHRMRRQRMKLRTVKDGVRREHDYLVTANALPAEQGKLALLILEDITEVTLLKSIIPICMHCKKIRDDQQYWRQVEAFFHHSIGVDFSHGVCPDCMRQYYPETGT